MSNRDLPFAVTHRVRDACLCLYVQRAARALARRYDEALRPVGLTNWQFSLLMSLNRAKPARIGEISEMLAMDRTTLTANLKPLARRGLVAVAADPDDKRSRRLKLLPAGRELLVEALPLWKRAQAATARRLARSSPGRLRADLSALA